LQYFAFSWFDDLTKAGYHWVSRYRAKTSDEVIPTSYQDGAPSTGWSGRAPTAPTGPSTRCDWGSSAIGAPSTAP
jgi:hypothetical protein